MRLFGRNSVIEKLRSAPQTIKQIYLSQDFKDASVIHKKAKKQRIPLYVVPASKIQKMGRTKNTQGVVAVIYEFEYVPYEDLVADALKKKKSFVFLDELNDPQNLGAIIRSLACIGKFSLVLPTHNSVEVTETVLRVASGGDNYVSIAKVSNISKAIRQAKDKGFWIVGSVVKGGESLMEKQLQFPLGLVIGSEQKGIRPKVKKDIDVLLTIPMQVETLSFNAAHATTVLCYEITRQKQINKK